MPSLYFHPGRMMSYAEFEARFGIVVDECPFCHNPYPVLYIQTHQPHVYCLKCGAQGPLVRVSLATEDPAVAWVKAAQLWNNRTPPQLLTQETKHEIPR